MNDSPEVSDKRRLQIESVIGPGEKVLCWAEASRRTDGHEPGLLVVTEVGVHFLSKSTSGRTISSFAFTAPDAVTRCEHEAFEPRSFMARLIIEWSGIVYETHAQMVTTTPFDHEVLAAVLEDQFGPGFVHVAELVKEWQAAVDEIVRPPEDLLADAETVHMTLLGGIREEPNWHLREAVV